MEDIEKQIRVMDISDEKNPKVLSTFPHPEGDYAERGGRSGRTTSTRTARIPSSIKPEST